MTPEYATIARALRRCTFVHGSAISQSDFGFIRSIDAMRYNEQAGPLTRRDEKSLRTLAQKYRRQLEPAIVALATSLEPKE